MKVAVIGAGIMGSGIAQIAAAAEHDVVVRDVTDAALHRADTAIRTSLARLVKAGKATEGDIKLTLGRLNYTTEIAEAVTGVDVVIEVVPEQLPLKHAVFAEIIATAPADALLGTNTSQLSITSVGAALGGRAPNLMACTSSTRR